MTKVSAQQPLLTFCKYEKDPQKPDIQNQYQEYWLIDPLEQLWNPGKVKILWRWDAQEPDCQILERWEKPQKAPSKEPNNYSFQIRIDLEGLRNIGVSFDKVYTFHMHT